MPLICPSGISDREIGTVADKGPCVRDRTLEGVQIKFTSTILPPYLRRAKSIEDMLPLRTCSLSTVVNQALEIAFSRQGTEVFVSCATCARGSAQVHGW